MRIEFNPQQIDQALLIGQPGGHLALAGQVVNPQSGEDDILGLRRHRGKNLQGVPGGSAGLGHQPVLDRIMAGQILRQIPQQGLRLGGGTHTGGRGVPHDEQAQTRPRAAAARPGPLGFRQDRRLDPHPQPLQQKHWS